MMKTRYAPLVLSICLLTGVARGQEFEQEFEFYPHAHYDPAIPRLQQVIGHSWGQEITSHREMERYLKALAEASPKIQLVKYGETWEGRALYYLIIASETNMARLNKIKAGMHRLADPRKTNRAAADQLISSLPVITWLAYGVHGNEISSTDAALLTAYHLLAAQNDPLTETVLNNSLVIIDPLENPDGRDRFVNYFRQTRGRWPDADPLAAEHNENWPGGRTNHYLFDMNRDWLALTQPETRGRVRAFLEWFPQTFVDLHEMGSSRTYYFPPQAEPLNPGLTARQQEWLNRFGRNTAKWFDRMKFDYFNREVYDAFYPGYGETWPMFQGTIGMTFEQASARGLLVRREDETTLRYRDGVQHHFISSLSTAETAATNRQALLRDFYEFRQSAIQQGRQSKVKEYIIVPRRDPGRAAKLVSLLMAQGIEVKQATEPLANGKVRDYYGGDVGSKTFPQGAYVISLAQPAQRLARTLLSKDTPLGEDFVEEQERRYAKHLADQIYDLTSWSLPLLFDVQCYMAEEPTGGPVAVLESAPSAGGEIHGEPASLAYLIPWGTNAAARALAHLFGQGIRVFSADKPFRLNGVSFPSGSLIIKLKNNPDDLRQRLEKLATEVGVHVYPTNTGWVEEGINLGSANAHYLKKPKVALAYQRPTSSSSAGWARYLIERVYDYPLTIIRSEQLRRADLSDYNVLILPDASRFFGGYNRVLGEAGAQRIKDWVRTGGTLITLGEATQWLTGEKVGLLATKPEFKPGASKAPPKESAAAKPDQAGSPRGTPSGEGTKPAEGTVAQPFDVEAAIRPEKELPGSTPGAIMRIRLDSEFWPAFGYDGGANVLVESRNIYTPIKLDKGRNIGLYMPEEQLLLSGFTWDDARRQIANKAYLMYQPLGRGQVIAFAEDPNYRAFCDGLNLLFMNGVLLGPGH